MDVTNFRKPYLSLSWVALIISFGLIVSLPILQAGFYNDDIVNSLIPGTLALYQQSFWGWIAFDMQNWLANGRLFPLSVISSISIFYLFPVVHDYQIIRSVFIWASILSCAWFVKVLTKNTAAAILFIFLIPLCWSMRNAPDPLTSFAILLPLIVIFTAWTLIFYRYYQTTQQPKFLMLSILTFTCAICTYEIGVVTFFLLLTLMYCKPVTQQSIVKEIKPFLILLTVYCATVAVLHLQSHHVYTGLQVSFNGKFWPAFFAQFTAALPLSYFLFAKHPTFMLDAVLSTHYIIALAYLFTVATGCLYYLLSSVVLTKRSCVCFSVMALFLLFVPAIIIGINQKYQLILEMGIGYIPVYVQYIGMGFLLLAGFGSLNLLQLSVNTKRGIHFALAVGLSFIITLATLLNLASVNSSNEKYKFTRVLVESAARHGLLNHLPDQSYLIEKLMLWNTANFYMLNAHKTVAEVIDARDTTKLLAFDPHNKLASHHKYYLTHYHLPGSTSGYVLLGRAKQAVLTSKTHFTKAILVTDPQLFVVADTATQRTQILQNLQQQLNLPAATINNIAEGLENNKQDWFIASLPAGKYRLLLI